MCVLMSAEACVVDLSRGGGGGGGGEATVGGACSELKSYDISCCACSPGPFLDLKNGLVFAADF